MNITGFKHGKTILFAASLFAASAAAPVSADHDSPNLAPLAAFIAFGALLHHGRHHVHRHYHHYRHAPRYDHPPRRHAHSYGGYSRPGKHYTHPGRGYSHPGKGHGHPGKRHYRKHR